MKKAIILARSEFSAEAIRKVLHVIGRRAEVSNDSYVVSINQSLKTSDIFTDCADWIEKHVDGHKSVTIIVDSLKPSFMNPIEAGVWESAISMLILAFPDVRWILGHANPADHDREAWQHIARFHSLASMFEHKINPLFDSSGLREWVKAMTHREVDYLPKREQFAAALDEETAYAEFHAYVAYRNGFRAFALTTDSAASNLPDDSRIALTFEDIYLNFPDRQRDVSYSSIPDRDVQFKAISKAEQRYFITVGHRFGNNHGRFSMENQSLFRQLSEEDRGGRVLNKPVAGMHGIWNETGLNTKLEWYDLEDAGRRYVGVGKGYIWPPNVPRKDENLDPGGHSAPGRLLQIAEHLILRAERLVGEVKNVHDAVRGAVLATDALELLGCRTPTLARDALELKHRFEVLAECQFGGVEYNLNLKPRFAEIRRDMEAICAWYGPDRRNLSLLNGELAIVSRLATIFRSYNEYDEEDACLHRIRELQTKIWVKKQGIKMLILWPIWWIRVYIEAIIVSPSRLALVIFGWVSVISLGAYASSYMQSDGWDILAYSIKSFFGGDPQVDSALSSKKWLLATVTSIGAVLGFLHLGIFIARLYSVISRK